MASRMEKYYHNNTDVPSRTKKNANLYDELYNLQFQNNLNNDIDIKEGIRVEIPLFFMPRRLEKKIYQEPRLYRKYNFRVS